MTSMRSIVVACAVGIALSISTTGAQAQPTFSIDWQSPTKNPVVPITEGDLLTIPGPVIVMTGGVPFPGLGIPAYPGAGTPSGIPGFVEVDALSFGRDAAFTGLAIGARYTVAFSVDEFAGGAPGSPPPSVFSEGIFGSNEASADVFIDGPPPIAFGPPPPLPPAPGGNMAVLDGNGLFPWGGPGLFLLEPNPPTPGIMADPGDNLDAMDLDAPAFPGGPGIFPVYFSLDSAFFDPFEGFFNSGSALANGFVGGDILLTPAPGGPPIVFAPSVLLGLDIFGIDTDDIDALAMFENGDQIYQPWGVLYDWTAGVSDMVLFSVRRGSAVIGMPDFFFGLPIEEGDILIPPPIGSPPGTPPGIWIAAENLGLATFRSGVIVVGAFGADDLDALDIVEDCNGNGVPDSIDIATGTSADCNFNLLPDECDIAMGFSSDCNLNGIPDECELATDCNG
ncbi:MAG: hypothetical protein KDC38_17020, partial [Planctomycetes bacterium]|nr:hypothetical protein [Planctomycetota bacterium]